MRACVQGSFFRCRLTLGMCTKIGYTRHYHSVEAVYVCVMRFIFGSLCCLIQQTIVVVVGITALSLSLRVGVDKGSCQPGTAMTGGNEREKLATYCLLLFQTVFHFLGTFGIDRSCFGSDLGSPHTNKTVWMYVIHT